MNRTILTVTGVLSASSLLLVDSAIKGTVLLAVAAVVALFLRRDSAATRHLVWLLAIVAMLVVPVLSAMLPQWRVLPAWASHAPQPAVVDVSPPSIGVPSREVIESSQIAKPADVERPAATAFQPAVVLPVAQLPPVTPAAAPMPTVGIWNWITALPLVWVIGFSVLILRLSAARWMLWNSERRATVICRRVAPQLAFESRSDSATANDPIVTAMETICSQLGISRPVTLLIHPNKTIPVVWGILRCRLMLPAAARQWSDEQLQSVLLHELAHVKRRDTIVQLLTQVACALHWFNPLVWFAAWRLDVERERSCDDLVLASGIRPSAYAAHLLDVVTGLSPARWTQSSGLAMARKSSLEGRLTAVLGKDLNRRSVSMALAGLALAVAVGIAVPIAMLRAADEKWNPPQDSHISSNDFSAYCVHDGKDTSFIIVFHGDFGSATESVSNPKTRTWTDSGTLTAKKPGIALSFHRTHTAPAKLGITTAPAEGRDLSKPAPPPREFGQKEYDLAKGRVFLLSDSGDVRQLDIATPDVTDNESAKKLAALIAAVPPSGSADLPKQAAKLTREMLEGIWLGERDGVNFEIRFLWFTEHQQAGWRVWKGGKNLGLQTSVLLDAGAGPARFVFRKGFEFEHEYGRLTAGEGGALLLDVTPNPHVKEQDTITSQKGIVLTRQPGEARIGPMHMDARAYYEVWQRYARANGDIPGAMVGELAAAVRQFIKYNPTWETVPKLNEVLPRLDATHDWKPTDAIALLDEVAGIQHTLLEPAPWKGTRDAIRQGETLPKKYADVTWGKEQPSGLRAAWVLEPSAAEHRIGTALKARLLVQNRGQVLVMLQVPTFHEGWVKGTDAKGSEVQVSGISWTTMALLNAVRLGPGAYIEINTPGVGIGPRADMGPWAGPRVGSNVLAKPGDELALTYSLVPLDGSEVGVSEDDPHVSGPGWWLEHIRTRLNRELPLPADAAERTRLLDRAVRELFATAPSAEETAAFIADKTPDALDALANRLAARTDVVSFSGKLPTAPAKFRVLAADPNADKHPRVVLGPGEYPLPSVSAERGNATLKIVGRPVGERRTNDAQLLFEPVEFTGKLPPDPHKLEVPDGWGTWAIVCLPNDGFFYLLHNGTVRKIDYSKPRNVTDTPANDLPAEFHDEVKRQLDIHEISDEQQAEMFENPAAPATSVRSDEQEKPKTAATELQPKTPKKEPFTAWGEEVNGVQIGVRLGEQRVYEVGESATLILRLRNNGKVEVPYRYGDEYFLKNPPLITDASGKPVTVKAMSVFGKVLLKSVSPGKEVDLVQLKLDLRPATDLSKDADWTIYGPGKFQIQYPVTGVVGEVRPDLLGIKLVTGKLELEVKEPFTAWGQEVGGLQAGLGFKAGEQRTYTHGETATLVVRVRNVGNKDVKFRYYPTFLSENSPTVLDETGKRVSLRGNILHLVHHDIPKEVNLAVGKEIELYERELRLASGNEDAGELKTRDIFPTGKFLIQHEQVIGNSAQASDKLDPALEKLATGKLELEIKPAAAVQQEAPKPKSGSILKPDFEQKLKWGEPVNGLRAALVMQPVPDVPDAEDKNDIFLVVQNVTKAEVWLHASDAAPNPRQLIWRDKGVLETINEEAKPIRADFRLQPGEVAFFRMTHPPGKRNPGGRSEGSLIEESIRKDLTFSLEGSMGISTAPDGAWSGKLVSGRTEGGTAIPAVPAEAANVLLKMKGEDADGNMMSVEELQRDEATSTVRVTTVGRGGGSVGGPMYLVRSICEIAKARGAAYFAILKEWDGEDGTRMFLIGFSKNQDIRPLTNERQPQVFAVSAYAWLFKDPAGADANKPPAKPPGANMVKLPDDQYVKSGSPQDELVGEGVMWNDEQNGLSLGYRITGDEWRILGKEVKVELWVHNPGDKDVKFQLNMRPDIGLRVKLKDAKGEDHNSDIWPNDTPPLAEHRLLPPGHALKVKEFTVSLFLPENDFWHAKGHFFGIAPGAYKFHGELELPGFSATGEGGKQLTPAEGEWTGKLTTRVLNVEIVAPDAPAPKPRIEHADVNLEKDGTLFLNGKQVTLDELKALAAKDAKKKFTIRADKDVPYAKVIELVEALKAAGVTEFSFSEARVGDGKYRVANRTGTYEFDDKHGFSICRPSGHPQWFTVSWPAEGDRPACVLRTFPNVSDKNDGKWAVVWEPGTDVLWWVDDSEVGKMTLTDPARVIVDHEGRTNNFSRDFGLPEEVKTEFRRLGFVIGRDKTPGLETAIGGNTGGQSIVSAEFGAWSVTGTVTDADGKPLADVSVRLTTNQVLKTEKTNAKGEYYAAFSMPLQLLAHWRGVTVQPMLEGFTERDMAKSGEFNVLLRAGEQPQRVRLEGDKDFQPGPIPRFAENDLLPSQPGVSPGKPGRADFVMLKAAEITGELVTADGKPAPPHWVAASTPEQRPGHNAAIQLSDDKGHFRLKGIPANKPVILTVNPDGKPGETSKSPEQKFEKTGAHKLRIFLPAEGSGKGPVKIERRADPEGGAALKPDANAAVRVVHGAARELRKSPPYNFRDSDQYRALDESSRSRLRTVVDDLAQLERALDSFMKDDDTGTPPETLEQLVPKYIDRLPEDPFASPDEKIPDDLKHYQRSLDGRGYLYLRKPDGKQWTSGAWEIRSVGLRTFPLRYEKAHPGLIHTGHYLCVFPLDVF